MEFTIGNQLKLLRCKKKLSQADVAKILKQSRQNYSSKETGKTSFSLYEAFKLMDLFQVPFESIFFKQVEHETC